ncbi:MAG: hypothetical protein Q4C47_05950 [Planctomycetia bacterium]|nr:hypothetical protein [Planctomycetia bacterium]
MDEALFQVVVAVYLFSLLYGKVRKKGGEGKESRRAARRTANGATAGGEDAVEPPGHPTADNVAVGMRGARSSGDVRRQLRQFHRQTRSGLESGRPTAVDFAGSVSRQPVPDTGHLAERRRQERRVEPRTILASSLPHPVPTTTAAPSFSGDPPPSLLLSHSHPAPDHRIPEPVAVASQPAPEQSSGPPVPPTTPTMVVPPPATPTTSRVSRGVPLVSGDELAAMFTDRKSLAKIFVLNEIFRRPF